MIGTETVTPTRDHHPAPPAAAPTPDLAAIKARQQTVWASGDYAVIGTTLQIVGETLCEAADVAAGERVLDVACGNGNATLAAARRFALVTGVDYVPALLDRARTRATADGLEVDLREGDAEALPFADQAFDVVLSTFGVMFTPDQPRAARELLRVCRRGGRIGLASWTPDGFIGKVFQNVGRYVPPAPGLRSPAAWGTEERLSELFEDDAGEIRAVRRQFTFRYRSPLHWLEVFRTWYGPIHRAFSSLPPDGQQALERDLTALMQSLNAARDGTLAVPATYLEAVVVRA
jgi:ubiquinone/menaquinone biosynthesis C-methylase UbiE